MKFKLLYLRTWLIIKRKQMLNFFPAKGKCFTKFVIVCAPRSGSTWLHTLLNSHAQIFSYGEILRETCEVNPQKQLPSLEELIFHPHHASIQAAGLKVFYEYETIESFKKSFQEIVADPSICIIHLIRKDKTAQFKSLKQAEATQQWSSGKPADKQKPIIIEPGEFEIYQNDLIQKEKEIDLMFLQHPCLKITYEDLFDQHEKLCSSIQEFLKVKPRKLFSLLQKQSGN